MSKKERFIFYQYALEWLKTHEEPYGYCYILLTMYNIGDNKWQIQDFPELIKYKPKELTSDLHWFPLDEAGRNKRMTILNTILS